MEKWPVDQDFHKIVKLMKKQQKRMPSFMTGLRTFEPQIPKIPRKPHKHVKKRFSNATDSGLRTVDFFTTSKSIKNWGYESDKKLCFSPSHTIRQNIHRICPFEIERKTTWISSDDEKLSISNPTLDCSELKHIAVDLSSDIDEGDKYEISPVRQIKCWKEPKTQIIKPVYTRYKTVSYDRDTLEIANLSFRAPKRPRASMCIEKELWKVNKYQIDIDSLDDDIRK